MPIYPTAYLIMVLLVCCPSLQCQEQEESPLTERELIIHTLSRLTFGADGPLVKKVEKQGLAEWLTEQLANTGVDEELAKKLDDFPSLAMSSQEIYEQYVDAGGRRRNKIGEELLTSIILRAVKNKWQASEVMTEFWRNHFNVDRAKGSVRYTTTEYDRLVLRDNVFGSFHTMLEASAKHPAMLVYLDNHISRKPPTKTELKTVARNVRRKTGSKERGQEAADIAAQRGINENYARELMELHTLGVDNGYTQKDVVELARALTGWTVNREKNKYTFKYDQNMHDGGDKFILGRAIVRTKKRNGIVEGEKIIARLANHKNTSEFLAKKLCVYLLNDDVPPKFLQQVAAQIRKDKFDLGAAVKHIVESKEFRSRRHYQSKFKTPFEFILSCLRVTGAEVESTSRLVTWLEEMGQPIYRCEDPTGYSDTAESWRDPGVMAFRWKFALDLVNGKIKGVTVPDSFFYGLEKARTPVLIKHLGDQVLPGGLRPQTITTLLRVARRHQEVINERADEIIEARKKGKKPPRHKPLPPLRRRLLAVLLGSPEFQKQ